MGKRETINLDELAEACARHKVNIHDIIAKALTDEMRDNEASGMNMKAQSDLAWKIMDKLEASKKAVEHDIKGGITVHLNSSDADL